MTGEEFLDWITVECTLRIADKLSVDLEKKLSMSVVSVQANIPNEVFIAVAEVCEEFDLDKSMSNSILTTLFTKYFAMGCMKDIEETVNKLSSNNRERRNGKDRRKENKTYINTKGEQTHAS